MCYRREGENDDGGGGRWGGEGEWEGEGGGGGGGGGGGRGGNKTHTEKDWGVRQAPREQLKVNRRHGHTAKLSIAGRESSRVNIQ